MRQEKVNFHYLMLAPALLVQAWLLLAGIVTAVTQSFGYIPTAGMTELTTRYYEELLKAPELLPGLGFSLYCGLTAAGMSTALGLGAAFTLRRCGKLVNRIVKLPVIMPHLVVVLLILFLCGKTGMLARVAFAAGLIADPAAFPDLVYDRWGLGIILTYTWKSTPFAALIFYTFLQKIDLRLYTVALNLGATKRQAFCHVLLPLLKPVSVTTFLLIFAYAFTAFETPLLIGPTLPKTLPVLAYNYYTSVDIEARPCAMAINTIMIAVSFLLLYFVNRTIRRRGWI